MGHRAGADCAGEEGTLHSGCVRYFKQKDYLSITCVNYLQPPRSQN